MNPDDEIQEIDIDDIEDVEEAVSRSETQTTSPTITINDIAGAVNIIDHAAKIGTFSGEELQEIGTIRNKLAHFVSIAKSTQPAPTEDYEVPPPPPSVEEEGEEEVNLPTNLG